MPINPNLLLKAKKQAVEDAYQGRVRAYSSPKKVELYRVRETGETMSMEDFVSKYSGTIRNYSLQPMEN